MLTGEVKKRLIEVLTEMVGRHCRARAAVTDKLGKIATEKYYSPSSPFTPYPPTPQNKIPPKLTIHKQEAPYDTEADEVRSNLSANSRKTQKLQKTAESGWAYTGSEYASKKARGDVNRKDKLEPYAYCPLDRKMMSRRPEQRAAARKGMASVVKLTKRLEGRSVSNALSMKGVKLKKGKKEGNQKKS
ncbi:uncharacterized protein LOC111381623 [Olea europaea var. sylvestris]|uniref:uncharacterized protein LOC111381623 n=1 Tax=Olea europaea var. sylvestris TaxID=158386 RepID=UPI000C1D305D|nr:uncharacterized protein LOC111381623 [Olea europaea var. sylvestris]